MLSLYRAVMDPNTNPLRNLPPAQRFQAMLFLSIMWTIVFCAAAGTWSWSGGLVIAHVLIALGFLATGLKFHSANIVKTYRDYPRRDGTARYDDVYGG
jgi:hypothetical protein